MINEKMKWPGNKKRYDDNYIRIFGRTCDICGGKGYHTDFDKIQKKWIRTTCLICSGTGRRKV